MKRPEEVTLSREEGEALIERIERKGRPVLVGTVSIEKSERLSGLLDKRGVKHEVLNAKHHKREAEIIAQAGRLGAVTIAVSVLLFVINVFGSLRKDALAGDNPWGAGTLEWATTSPPASSSARWSPRSSRWPAT